MTAGGAADSGAVESRYREAVARDGFDADSEQLAVARRLDALRARLVAAGPVRPGGLARWWRGRRDPVDGLYLWGGVGRGKSYLVDRFHESLPFTDALRLHFHRLMRAVHSELKRRGGEDPLPRIAADFARRARVICIDEFSVGDIADAMILGRWMGALFEAGVTLVATSNTPPDDLYRDGLQRQRFLPAIAAIKSRMDVAHLETGTDYRLRALETAEIYHMPLDAGARRALAESFRRLAPEAAVEGGALEVNSRELATVKHADGVAWFDFEVLCGGPRSADDYVELAGEHHTLLVSGVPAMDDDNNNAARRFIALVDECYDRNVKLLVSAAAPPPALYRGRRLAFEYQRTASRLVEMQSHDYLAREHRP